MYLNGIIITGLFVLGSNAWRKSSEVTFKLFAKKESRRAKRFRSKSLLPELHTLPTSQSVCIEPDGEALNTDKRRRRNYQDNHTAALALPYTNAEIHRCRGNQSALLALCEDHIIEHANRRIDLFFYTLVAYYRSNAVPVLEHTNLQYGKGRSLKKRINLTQACHSSFTPSLKLLLGTHFSDSINSTVELPPVVNVFDNMLELICRPKALEILTDVAQNKMNPIQGLTRFLTIMNSLLNDIKQKAAEKNVQAFVYPSFFESHDISAELIELVYIGTLKTTFSSKSGHVNQDYIQLLLRLKYDEKARCLADPIERDLIYLDKMMEIQREILETPSQTEYRPV
jgi:hypothetical protein